MKTITLDLKERSYPIIIDTKGFEILAKQIKKMALGTDAVIITNSRIFNLYAKILTKSLKSAGIKVHFQKVKDSEESKSINTYIKTIQAISKIDTKKRIFLIALGGGVIGDLCGFIAATYKRGVPCVQIPTTLLAQVDSSIGGKTAIDLPSGKNLVGAFFQPRIVYSNIKVLNSLPQRQIKSGLAEVIKYGIIVDKNLFSYLEKNTVKILNLDPKSLEHIISVSSNIKAKIVAFDEKETKGLRTILNFGHTIGHALETATKYTKLNHGEAVAIGMVCAADIALNMGLLDLKIHNRIISLIKAFKLPTQAKNINLNHVFNAFYRDKKFINGKIRMVLPTNIGHVIVTEDITFNEIKKVIQKRVI
ncbi:MAG: 3-dehydroquinate synthase [PVC group bacterium]|nr:3-dehydroquinate synthase [PVC group bacterium]